MLYRFANVKGIPVTTVAAIKHHLGLAPPEALDAIVNKPSR